MNRTMNPKNHDLVVAFKHASAAWRRKEMIRRSLERHIERFGRRPTGRNAEVAALLRTELIHLP
jgi:hypothetical protein